MACNSEAQGCQAYACHPQEKAKAMPSVGLTSLPRKGHGYLTHRHPPRALMVPCSHALLTGTGTAGLTG